MRKLSTYRFLLLLVAIPSFMSFRSAQGLALGPSCKLDRSYPVKVFLFSSDDRLFVTNLDNSNVNVWDMPTGKLIRTFFIGSGKLISSADISPDNNYIAVASQDGKVTIWDVNTGTQLQTLLHPTGSDVIVKFSPNGKYLLTYGFLDNPSEAILWNPLTGQKIHVFPKDGDPRGWLAFSPSGNYLAIQYDDDSGPNVALWDITPGEKLKTFTPAARAAISPNDKLIVVNRIDSLLLWDVVTKNEIKTISLPTSAFDYDPYEPEFSHDGKYLLLKGINVAFVWDTDLAKQPYVIDAHAEFSPDGRYLIEYKEPLGNDDTSFTVPTLLKLHIANIASGETVWDVSIALPGPLIDYAWAYSAHEDYLALLDSTLGSFEIRDGRTGKILRTFSC